LRNRIPCGPSSTVSKAPLFTGHRVAANGPLCRTPAPCGAKCPAALPRGAQP
jgi:hypothetical protein